MRIQNRLVRAWLRIPERGIDVISILLASSGINLLTSALGATHSIAFLISGFAVTTAAVMVILLKHYSSLIRKTLEYNVNSDREALQQLFENGGDGEKPQPRTTLDYLDSAISEFLEESPEARRVVRGVTWAVLFAFVGITTIISSTLLSERNEHRNVATRAEGLQKRFDAFEKSISLLGTLMTTQDRLIEQRLKQMATDVDAIKTDLASSYERQFLWLELQAQSSRDTMEGLEEMAERPQPETRQ
ncbi:MAG: hypothetical protein JW888_08085 [Pirellulales bacterium]|nr:hypothetical protein [Pirellulales bacterium]